MNSITNAELAILGLIVEQPRHGYEIEQVIEALEADPDIHKTELPAPLTRLLGARRAA